MSAYIPFNPHVDMCVRRETPATSATPATLPLEEASSASNDVEISCPDGSQPPCYSLLLAATPEGKVAASSNRVATDAAPILVASCRANTGEGALLEAQSSESSESSIGISPHTYTDTASMMGPSVLPCVVCGGHDRWNHHGIWRCVACWPPEAFGLTPGGVLCP
jgi:hypothetical protein